MITLKPQTRDYGTTSKPLGREDPKGNHLPGQAKGAQRAGQGPSRWEAVTGRRLASVMSLSLCWVLRRDSPGPRPGPLIRPLCCRSRLVLSCGNLSQLRETPGPYFQEEPPTTGIQESHPERAADTLTPGPRLLPLSPGTGLGDSLREAVARIPGGV